MDYLFLSLLFGDLLQHPFLSYFSLEAFVDCHFLLFQAVAR